MVKRLGPSEVGQVVEPLAAAGKLARASICALGVGYSPRPRNAEEWDVLVGALDAFELDSTAAHQHRALRVQRLLAERSQRGRKIPDLLIAAAEELDIAVLHYDADFDRIASVTGQRCPWVVPGGAVQ